MTILQKKTGGLHNYYTLRQKFITDYDSQLQQVSLAKWLSVCIRTKGFWVRVQLQSLKLFTNYDKILLEITTANLL